MSNSSSCSSRPTKSRSTLPLSLASSDGSNCTLVGSTSTGSGASNGGSHVAFNGNEECKLPSVASSRQFSVVNSGGNSRLVGGSATTITENVDTTPGSKSSKANGDNMASTNSSTPNYVPSPEIMFMVREHAKTISAISSISKRLEQLEVKVCDIQKNVTQCNSSNSKTEPKASTSSTVPQVLSDDSGGEYSRTTNGTNVDEDELLSLLDQIAKCSQQIRETQQAQLGQQSALMNSLPRDSVVAPPPPPPLQSSTAHPWAV
ncbi:hypothetical protein HDE_14198 [Halotydeus destructor]|nr:hypothetical protein HDE_14198 [Halotydeus destructor]